MAFQQQPYTKRKEGTVYGKSSPQGFFLEHGGLYGRSLRTCAARKPLETKSTRSQKSSKRKHSTKIFRRRSLNSEIFRLRKGQNGINEAEKRLEEAIADMIEEHKKAGIDITSSLLQRRNQMQNNQQQEAGISDEILGHLPDIVSFHAVISSHAKHAQKDRLAARQAMVLLAKMKELSGVFPHLSPTIFSYNAVMEAYCNQISKHRSKVGYEQRLLKDQEVILRLYQELQETGLSPNTYTRNMILASISNASEEWRQLESWAYNYLDDNSDDIIPDRKTYNTLFSIYSFVGNADGAEKMLRKLLKWYASLDKGLYNKQKGFQIDRTIPTPTKIGFHCVLKALAISDLTQDEHDERVQQLLVEMRDLVKLGNSSFQPDTITYNHVFNVYAKHGNFDMAVNLMKKIEKSSNESDVLDSVSYTTVIKSFATAQKKIPIVEAYSSIEMAKMATEIFERMQKKAILPTILTYNTLISIWVNVGTRDALNKADDLLSQIRYPDSVSYSTLIHGWSKTRFREAGSRARKLFNEVLRLPSNRLRGNFSMTILCNSVITAYSRCGDEDAPERVDSLLAQLEGRFLSGDATARPDKITFLGIFNTYAKTGISNAEERCDVMLDRMSHYKEMLELEDMVPDRVVYNAVLDALAKSQQPDAIAKAEDTLTMMESSPDEHLRPDIITYATAIDCFTKCGGMSLQRADKLLRFVEGTFRSGNEMLKPNAVFYSAILQAWAKTATVEGAEKAENLLKRNIGLYAQGYDYAKPHTIVFNAVMDAIARSNMFGAGARAEELLDEMESLYQLGDEDMRPSRRSFNAVILAYRNEGNASKKAEELFNRMKDMAASGRIEVRPNVVSYNNVIAAVVEDRDSENTADRAQALLDQMESSGIKPDGRTYSPVIEAWLRRNDEKGHALADVMLTQFLDNVEKSKKQNISAKKESLYEDAVWNVINAYRENSDNDFYSQLASRGWINGG